MKTKFCDRCSATGLRKYECHKCKGTDLFAVDVCIECDGEGVQECDMGHEHNCDDCNGTGKMTRPGAPVTADEPKRCECQDTIYLCFLCRGAGVIQDDGTALPRCVDAPLQLETRQ